jgi:hypothetical protein
MLFSGLHELRGARFSFFFPFLFWKYRLLKRDGWPLRPVDHIKSLSSLRVIVHVRPHYTRTLYPAKYSKSNDVCSEREFRNVYPGIPLLLAHGRTYFLKCKRTAPFFWQLKISLDSLDRCVYITTQSEWNKQRQAHFAFIFIASDPSRRTPSQKKNKIKK